MCDNFKKPEENYESLAKFCTQITSQLSMFHFTLGWITQSKPGEAIHLGICSLLHFALRAGFSGSMKRQCQLGKTSLSPTCLHKGTRVEGMPKGRDSEKRISYICLWTHKKYKITTEIPTGQIKTNKQTGLVSIVAVPNHHKPGSFKHIFIIFQFCGSNQGINSAILPEALEENLFPCLLQLLETASIPWLVPLFILKPAMVGEFSHKSSLWRWPFCLPPSLKKPLWLQGAHVDSPE
jgi:hypothetical protein